MNQAALDVDLFAPTRARSHNAEVFPGWSQGRVQGWLDHHGARLFSSGLAGEALGLALGNNVPSLLALLLISASGGVAVLFGPESTAAEQAAVMRQAGALRKIVPAEAPTLIGDAVGRSHFPNGVVLSTSASTGAPKLVHRSVQSLLKEGRRYVGKLQLGPGARILIPAPIVHAYALGWFAACLEGGWCAVPLPPTALARIAEEMGRGADWAVMTPTVARLLAARPRREMPARCRVMVGAGPVTSALERAFRTQFGTGIARNYGSTETGAVLCGFEDLPSRCVGTPMPGIQARIIDESGCRVPAETPGLLEIAAADGWHAMGDLVMSDLDGRVTVLGRRTQALRRGDTWIAPLEVEEYLMGFSGLRAARVAKAERWRDGRERLIADIWPNDPSSFDMDAFAAYLEKTLQPSKRPEKVCVRALLQRSDAGKLKAPTAWRRGSAVRIAAAARAYKRSELLFALEEAGVLDALDGRKNSDQVAEELGLEPGALETLLALSARFGLVELGPGDAAGRAPSEIVSLEAKVSRCGMQRSDVLGLLRSGLSRRGMVARAEVPADEYLRAMNGDSVAFRVRFGLRLLELAPGGRLLEATPGPGLYGETAAMRGIPLAHTVWRLGPAASAPPCDDPIRQTGELFDSVVLFNGLRWSPVPDRLADLKSMLNPRGIMLIDELFLEDDESSAEFALDWITQSAPAFLTVAELTAALEQIGMVVEVRPVPCSAHARIILARHSTV